MKLPWLAGPAVGVASLALLPLVPSAAHAADDWEATMGELGRNASRYALHLGAGYGGWDGTEVSRVDPALGFEVAASFRAYGNYSLYAGYALASADVQGQVAELLDQKVRPDGRSGNVDGSLDVSRFRVGVRIDALREQNWRFQPYVVFAAVFSTSTVDLNSVDGAPPRPSPNAEGELVDIRSFDDSQIGAMGRIGLEWMVLPRIGVNAAFTYEGIELPPGTHAIIGAGTGLTFRF